jgi:LuxR family transcriptional regulator, maltose regulon positive regulatory protein
VTGQSEEDIALSSDLRAVALMNLGILEAWSLALPDAERHLREGAALAREFGRPYLEVSCLAQLGFASKIHPFAVTQRLCREAIAAAERHGWGAEPVIAPALLTLAASLIYTGDLDEGERWLQRADRALEGDTGPGIRLLAHLAGGMLQAGHGRLREAAAEFGAALGALQEVLDGTAPVIGYLTVIESQLLAGLAHGELGDQRAANRVWGAGSPP